MGTMTLVATFNRGAPGARPSVIEKTDTLTGPHLSGSHPLGHAMVRPNPEKQRIESPPGSCPEASREL